MTPQNLMRGYVNRGRALVLAGTVCGLLAISNAFLAIGQYYSSDQAILTPTHVRDGMVARGSVDKAYVEALALDTVYAMYNMSPNTIQYGRASLERLSGPVERAGILELYDRIAEDIRARKISTVFRPVKIEHNFEAYEVVVDGYLATYLETTQVSQEERRILVRFRPQAGSVRVSFIGKLEGET
ncbi:TraE/TraK family type IV conjugative transfer system protein [Ruegeria sp. HKCCD8929]|uniref:TraE/TraK family type IV conjugative transfer system protein n=1 Tax=Ruegeria sp. HKCCD8929 TaxID=2683006 RepID=UPI0014880BE0|nr:TraE/TraK family type IV conjugative transfer system protein [Ruegeria sp. HKCCD8929]